MDTGIRKTKVEGTNPTVPFSDLDEVSAVTLRAFRQGCGLYFLGLQYWCECFWRELGLPAHFAQSISGRGASVSALEQGWRACREGAGQQTQAGNEDVFGGEE